MNDLTIKSTVVVDVDLPDGQRDTLRFVRFNDPSKFRDIATVTNAHIIDVFTTREFDPGSYIAFVICHQRHTSAAYRYDVDVKGPRSVRFKVRYITSSGGFMGF